MGYILRALQTKRFWYWLLSICWLFGHSIKGAPSIKGYLHSSGRWTDGWQNYCEHCQLAPGEGAEALNFPYRNILSRNISLWIYRWRNERLGRKFARNWKNDLTSYREYLDNQSKKYTSN